MTPQPDSLREVRRIRQRDGGVQRRWYTSSAMDVFLWESPEGEIVGFQVTYDKPWREQAVSWREGEALRHASVMVGGPVSGGHPGSPLLIPEEHGGAWTICGLLNRNAGSLAKSASDFICRKITSATGNVEALAVAKRDGGS